MCDQDSRSLSLSLLYRKQPLKEYTLYEAVDEIIVIQNLPDNKKIRDRLERMLKDAIHTGDLKAKNGVRYHEYLEYPQFLSLNPKQLSHYIISGDELYKWVCGEEEPRSESVKLEDEEPVPNRSKKSWQNVIANLYQLVEDIAKENPNCQIAHKLKDTKCGLTPYGVGEYLSGEYDSAPASGKIINDAINANNNKK